MRLLQMESTQGTTQLPVSARLLQVPNLEQNAAWVMFWSFECMTGASFIIFNEAYVKE
ncbi:hypothetical protein JQR88_22165 (plasmid) [Pseudomonas luteola]|uniref:hypothetical protein n=1 Tax=Pseudomonas luteola TaxID=47886 RepID=UPI003D9FEE4D